LLKFSVNYVRHYIVYLISGAKIQQNTETQTSLLKNLWNNLEKREK